MNTPLSVMTHKRLGTPITHRAGDNRARYTVQIREVWPGRPGYQGLVRCVLMADTVVRHCSSPITVIVYTKYLV